MRDSVAYPEFVQGLDYYTESAPALVAERGYVARTQFLPLFFLAPTLICGISWMTGGVQFLTDFGMVLLASLCGAFLIGEFIWFPRRFGIGGLVLFGGVLNWICYDYFTNWFGINFRDPSQIVVPATLTVVAKTAYFYCLLICAMSLGITIDKFRGFERIFRAVPNPTNPNFFFWLTIAAFVFGISPYVFNTHDFFWVSIWNEICGRGVRWIYGRDGNLNYSWTGYIAHMVDVGQVGGQLAVFYAILIPGSVVKKVLAWLIWAFWLIYAFNTGRRGQVMFAATPAAALLFIKYQAVAIEYIGRPSVRAYVLSGVVFFVALVLIQIQGQFRSTGLRDVELNQVDIVNLRGNSMFSEALPGFQWVPEQHDFFCNDFGVGGIVRPIPEVFIRFVIHGIPRALWKDKPVDPVWVWLNNARTGENNEQGTTVSSGLAGWYYLRFGFWGIVEGGLLWGWLMRRSEAALQNAQGHPFVILFSLGFVVWLFRCYRDVSYVELYPLVIAAVFLWFIVKVTGAARRTELSTT